MALVASLGLLHPWILFLEVVLFKGGRSLGPEVRRLEGIVGGDEPAVGGPSPGAGVAGEPARAAFYFDEEEAKGGVDEEVDFVDRAVEGDELEERPGPVGLVLGEPLAHEVEGITLPG